MNSHASSFSPQVRTLLEREQVIAPLPASVRAHMMARARAALVADPMPARKTLHAMSTSGNRWAAAAALIAVTAVTAVAAGAAAYVIRAQRAPLRDGQPTPGAAQQTSAAPRVAIRQAKAETQTDVQPSTEPAPAGEMPHRSRAGAIRAELRLLHRARAAVASERFAAAMIAIEEHTHQFKDGRLAEEREALRVKALSGLGRTDDARRAAAAFQYRFPRSVLWPAVSRMPAPATALPTLQ